MTFRAGSVDVAALVRQVRAEDRAQAEAEAQAAQAREALAAELEPVLAADREKLDQERAALAAMLGQGE
jgi:hypothetical protein